jgi:hypothetical protein
LDIHEAVVEFHLPDLEEILAALSDPRNEGVDGLSESETLHGLKFDWPESSAAAALSVSEEDLSFILVDPYDTFLEEELPSVMVNCQF